MNYVINSISTHVRQASHLSIAHMIVTSVACKEKIDLAVESMLHRAFIANLRKCNGYSHAKKSFSCVDRYEVNGIKITHLRTKRNE